MAVVAGQIDVSADRATVGPRTKKMTTIQTIDEINSVITPVMKHFVELGISPHDQSEFLRLYRIDKKSGEHIFVTSLPRETGTGIICSFAPAMGHYYRLGLEGIQL